MADGGWLKLYRELIEKPIWKCTTSEQKAILITLLCMANHEEQEWIWQGKKYKCKPGQFITSLKSIAEKSGTSIKNVRTALKNFEQIYEFSASEATNKNRLVTITNWELYQSREGKAASRTASKRQASGKQAATNKNDKNDKNEKNIYIGLSENMKNAINDFIEMRKKIRKPMTERAIQIMLKKLDGLAKDETTKIAILEQSTERGWLSVFPLKEDKPSQKQPPPQATNFPQRTYSDEFYKKILNRF